MRRVVITPRRDPVDAPARPRLRHAFGYSDRYDDNLEWPAVVLELPVRAHARRGAYAKLSQRRPANV